MGGLSLGFCHLFVFILIINFSFKNTFCKGEFYGYMVNLRVISFWKIILNIKRFFVISFGILIILSVINGIKIFLICN